MFNTTIITPRTQELVPYEKTVTVNRAPTDESIRLWDEMKEKAYKSILGQVTIQNNTLEAGGLLVEDVFSLVPMFYYRFVLNGKTYQGKEPAKGSSWESKEESIRVLYQKISEEITKQLLERFL